MSGNLLKSIKSRSRKNILLAPHVDDELIGAYSLIRMGNLTHIWYFEELTADRREEAKKFCEAFNLEPLFGDEFFSPDLKSDDVLIAPTVHDSHPAHKRVNRLARILATKSNCRILFYSADMCSPKKRPLSPGEQADKRQLFEKFYPSQAALLTDPKYFIFEDIFSDENIYGVAACTGDISISIETFGYKVDEKGFQERVRYCKTVDDVLAVLSYDESDTLRRICVIDENGATFYG